MRRIGSVIALLALSTPVLARELPAFFEGVRPLGMGGAFTAVADDENALFYNPAGLDRVEKWGMGVLNPLLDVNKRGMDFYRDSRDTDFNDTAEVTQLLRDYIGDNIHYRAALFPNFHMKNFAVGVLGQATVNLQANNPAFPEAQVDATVTESGHVGAGFGFYDGRLRIGGGLKYVRADRLEQVYTAEDIASENFEDQLRDDRKTGAGFGLDVGAMVEFPVSLKPTLALAVLNLGDADLGDAGRLEHQVNFGASVSHSFEWLTLVGAADWVDVTGNLGTDDDLYKRLHFGLEARLPKVLAVRAGLYQGYGSFGATVDLWIFKLDYATYAEELGAYAGQRADRRHVVQATLGW